MKSFVKFFFIALCIVFATTAAHAQTLKVICGFPTTNQFTEVCMNTFEKNLLEISGNKIKLSIQGPDVVALREQFQPVQAGIFDLLFTQAAHHLGTTAMGSAIEAIDVDPVKRRSNGIIKAADAEYQKYNMRLLAMMPAAPYGIILNKPLSETSPSLKGLKIRTVNAIAPMIKTLGGVPVNLPPGEIYTAMQKGVIDGFTMLSIGLTDYKTSEIAKYLVRPQFGYISFALLMNADKFNKMTPEEQEWIQAAAIKSEVESMEIFKQRRLAEVEKLKSLGMKILQLPPEDASSIDDLFKSTLWAVTEKKSPKPVKDLHKMAIEKGMAK